MMELSTITPIPNFPGYGATRSGCIYSTDCRGKPRILKMKFFRGKRTRFRITLRQNGKRCGRFVHRLIAETFISNPRKLPFVFTYNGDHDDTSADNLYWSSQEEYNLETYKK